MHELTVHQEDEDELTRRKDLEEDVDIDVIAPHSDFPHRPEPVTSLPPNLGEDEKEVVDKSVQAMKAVSHWIDGAADDGDTWEGFFISVDMLDKGEEGDE